MRTWPPSPDWPTPEVRALAPRRGALPFGLASAAEADLLRQALVGLVTRGPDEIAERLDRRGARGGPWDRETVIALAFKRVARVLYPDAAAAARAALAARRTEEL